MQEIENVEILRKAALKMDRLSDSYCSFTDCNDERMKSVNGDNNCEWYHGSWMYCRLTGIVVSNDYLGSEYSHFFENCHSNHVNILLCGLADYALLAHLLRRVPECFSDKISVYLIDICESPLKLCQWYLTELGMFPHFANCVHYVKADAANLPFADNTFDLITSYSFLTRMIFSESQKICNEWYRVLKPGGMVLTTIHVTNDEIEGDFYRSKSGSTDVAMAKVDKYAKSNQMSHKEYTFLKRKVQKYVDNIMSSALSENNVRKLFHGYIYEIAHFDQPGELESVHKMVILKASKRL